MKNKIKYVQVSEYISKVVCTTCEFTLSEHLPFHQENKIPDKCPNCGQRLKGEIK